MKFLAPAFIRKSLQVKFLSLLLALLFLLAFLISVVFSIYQNGTQRKLVSNQAKAFASLSVGPLGNAYTTYFDSGSAKFKEIVANNLVLDSNIAGIELIDVNGKLLYTSDPKLRAGKKISSETLLEAVNSDTTKLIESSQQISVIVEPYYDDFGAHSFSIAYFIFYDSFAKNFSSTIPLALLVSFLVAIVSGLIVILTVNRLIISPVGKIATGASAISKGKHGLRIDLRTGDELETLAHAVNQMASSLQKNIEDLKDLDRLKDEFIVIASHNLRTPITVIKGYLNQLNTDSSVKKVFKEQIESMIVSVSKLEGLIEELLNIVSLETQKKISQGTKLNLSGLIAEVLSFYSKEALEKKVTIQFVSGKVDYFIEGDVTKLKVVFNNLIENALKFNKQGGSIKLKIEENGEQILISIADSGIGISEKEIPLVFNKFHRATDFLEYNYQGLGLGLYLARVIVEAHQGKIWFESKEKEGSIFYVSLPKSKS